MRILTALLPAIALIVASSSASASSFDGRPKILLHGGPVVAKNACSNGSLTDCTAASTSGTVGTLAFIYLIAVRGGYTSLDGIACGISYDHGLANGAANQQGIDVFGWHSCATTDLLGLGWPNPGGGGLITWTPGPCATDESNVAGYFYAGAYAADTLRVTVRPGDVHAIVANCALQQTDLTTDDLGSFVFSTAGDVSGCNSCLTPCQPDGGVPIEPTTWSRIKSLGR